MQSHQIVQLKIKLNSQMNLNNKHLKININHLKKFIILYIKIKNLKKILNQLDNHHLPYTVVKLFHKKIKVLN